MLFSCCLESLCVDYTLQAMHRHGWTPVEGEVVKERQLAERLGVVSRHHRLFGRLLAIAARGGVELSPAINRVGGLCGLSSTVTLSTRPFG